MDRREYFIAIAEELNISKAAQRIYVSQQSLSMYLKKLEEFYKVELIVRKPKLMLTPAGKALLETYKKMERIERNLVTEINEIVSGAKGSITVGIHSARSTLLLPEAIEMFLHEYPSISFNIIDGHVSQFEQDLQNGKIDIFIGVKPTNNKNFASELLIHEKMLLAISDNLIREYFGDDVESFKEQFAEGIDIKECAKLPFIMWYRKNEPEKYEKSVMYLQTNGYISYMLTGEFSIDLIHAISVQGMDFNTHQWSEEISELVDIPFKKLFPKISEPYEVIGRVNKRAAEITGLPVGVPVMAGATDTIAAYLGFGTVSVSGAAEMTGTSTLLFFNNDKKIDDYGKMLVKPSPVAKDKKVLVAAVNSTGGSANWFQKVFKNEKGELLPFDAIAKDAECTAPGSGGVIYFPYLAGERSPLFNSYAKGMFIGMTYNTGRKELARAMYEGTSYAIRHNFDEVAKIGTNPEYVASAGGGTGSDEWLRIKAAVLNRPLYVMEENGTDRAALGDAILAAYGIGLIDDIEKVSKNVVKVKKVIEPNKEWVKIYDDLYPLYRSMYSNLESNLMKLSDLDI